MMCQKDKSKHIFVQYVNIYLHLHLSKPDVITIFCVCCLDQYFRHKSTTTVTCPVCPKAISINDIKAADERFQQQLFALDMKCSKYSYT